MNCPIETGGNAGYLLDYVSGKLNAEARALMAQHVESCAACRQATGSQQAVWQALDQWEPAAVSMDFDRRLFERIEQQPVSWWSRFTLPVNLLRHAVPVAATAAVVLMAGLLMIHPSTAPVAVPPQSAQVQALQPDQVQHALDDMEMLRDLSHLISADTADAKKM